MKRDHQPRARQLAICFAVFVGDENLGTGEIALNSASAPSETVNVGMVIPPAAIVPRGRRPGNAKGCERREIEEIEGDRRHALQYSLKKPASHMVAVPKVWPWSSDVHLRGEFDLLRREQTFTSQKEVSVQRSSSTTAIRAKTPMPAPC